MEHIPSRPCSTCTLEPGTLRCSDCLGDEILCRKCCITVHQRQPFHHIQIWTGKFFADSSLYHQGYILHMGHGGSPCPAIPDMEWNDWNGVDNYPTPDTDQDGTDQLHDSVPLMESDAKETVMVIVHTSGVFHHTVRWCGCAPNNPERDCDLHLLRLNLFPASRKQPRTAFTFQVLDHFYLDAMECKTSASGFWTKITRLTNNAFPGSVPVCSIYKSCCSVLT